MWGHRLIRGGRADVAGEKGGICSGQEGGFALAKLGKQGQPGVGSPAARRARSQPLSAPWGSLRKIPQLRREHLEDCGHWTQMERYRYRGRRSRDLPSPRGGGKPGPSPALCRSPRPAELNRILVGWLEGLPPDTPLPKISRL